ncbi:MAG TPA: hypothetical protein VHF22_16005, partial [Planctomycetota bacterium]|nr:hypothetical protein [Planctomycetota bacterium]
MRNSSGALARAFFAAAVLLGAAAPARALTIQATYDASITGNPNAAAIEATIGQAIAIYQSTFFDPVTIPIKFAAASSGLGGSLKWLVGASYPSVRDQLSGDRTSAADFTAVSHLPGGTTFAGSSSVYLSIANAMAMGYVFDPAT